MKLHKIAWILLVSLLLLSCGTAGNSTDGSTDQPTVLHVTRPANNGRPTLKRTVEDAAMVQHLYAAANALPSPSPGGQVLKPGGAVNHCGMDNGMIYQMDFYKGKTLIQEMTLQATGCQTLQIGQDTNNIRVTNQAFLSLLMQTIDIPTLVPTINQQ